MAAHQETEHTPFLHHCHFETIFPNNCFRKITFKFIYKHRLAAAAATATRYKYSSKFTVKI